MPIQLRVLGSRQLVADDGHAVVRLLAQPKRFALFAYLVIEGPFRIHSRDELLALFWPECSDAKARNALTQALSFIRRALGPDVVDAVGTNGVAVRSTTVECDAVRFERAIANGDQCGALSAYAGELLPGLYVAGAPEFERWLEETRARLHRQAGEAARTLADRHYRGQDKTTAIQWTAVAARLLPYDEELTRRLMTLYQETGSRTNALASFDAYAARLRSELDAAPSSALVSLRESIRSSPPDGSTAGGNTDAVPVPVVPSPARVLRPTPAKKTWTRARWIATSIAACAAAAAIAHGARPAPALNRSAAYPGSRLSVPLDDSVRVRSDLVGVLIAFDPSGSRFVYVGGSHPQRLYLRDLREAKSRALAGTEDAKLPQFTADGKSIAFIRDGSLRRLNVDDGTIATIVDSADRYSLGADGRAVFALPRGTLKEPGLYYLPPRSDTIEQLTRLNPARGESEHTWPYLLPDGSAALLEIAHGLPDSSELAVVRLRDHAIVRLGVRGHNPRYVAPGYILFGRSNGTVYGARFDSERLLITGSPTPLLSDVVVKGGGATQIALSDAGTLVYLPTGRDRQIVVLNRSDGTMRTVSSDRAFSSPRFSPDGRRIAVAIDEDSSRNVWIVDAASGAMSQVTRDGRSDTPEWAPSGRLFWRTDRSPGIWSQPWDGHGEPTRVLAGTPTAVAISPDGRFLVAASIEHVLGNSELRYVQLDSLEHAGPAVNMGRGARPRISPDGRMLAYVSTAPRVRNVYVKELVPPHRELQVTTEGGTDPVWGRTAQDLFYRAGGTLTLASLATGSGLVVARREVLFRDQFWSASPSSPHYDVSRDGTRLIAVESAGTPDQPIVIFNWTETIRSRFVQIARR